MVPMYDIASNIIANIVAYRSTNIVIALRMMTMTPIPP